MDGALVYKSGTGVRAGSHCVVSVTNAAAGLWDVVFAYTSRTADQERFLVQSALALGDAGACDADITAIAATTITIRVNTRNLAGADADKHFSVWFKELG